MACAKSNFREILSHRGELSSKRVFGSIGFIVCLLCLIFETIVQGDQLPSGYEVTLITCAGLLGVDSVVKAFSKSGEKQNDNGSSYQKPSQRGDDTQYNTEFGASRD